MAEQQAEQLSTRVARSPGDRDPKCHAHDYATSDNFMHNDSHTLDRAGVQGGEREARRASGASAIQRRSRAQSSVATTVSRVTYVAAEDRYSVQPYRRCGRSGLLLPAVSLGFWHNFGDDKPLETQRAVARRAFDLGITHFDLANNYGPPYGAAELNAGRLLREDFAPYRDELIISTKAGWDMWPGPYGDLGSRKYLLASLDASLRRLGLDYVDIFYHHRPDPIPRSRRRCQRWMRPYEPARRSMSASPPTRPSTRLRLR